jgi:uncharacterized protein (DUF927 family)
MTNAKAFYGSAARSFIGKCVDDLEAVKREVLATVEGFVDGRKLKDADSQVKRVAARFGLAAAAGELAAALGIVPWEQGSANAAAANCFQAWIDDRGGIEAVEVTNGIAAMRGFLSRHGASRFEAAWEDPQKDNWGQPIPPRIIANQAGFKRKVITEDGEEAWDYFLTPEAWEEATRGFNPKALAYTLAARGFLLADGGRRTKSLRIPGHSRQRVYHVSHAIFEGPDE